MRNLVQKLRRAVCCMMGLMLVAMVSGCGEQKALEKAGPAAKKPAATAATPTAASKPKAEAEPAAPAAAGKAKAEADKPTAKVLALLAKADAADGKTDKVVSKCTGCGLGMDGDAQFASTIGGYQLHMCSTDCKDDVDKDPIKAILALKFPE